MMKQRCITFASHFLAVESEKRYFLFRFAILIVQISKLLASAKQRRQMSKETAECPATSLRRMLNEDARK